MSLNNYKIHDNGYIHESFSHLSLYSCTLIIVSVEFVFELGNIVSNLILERRRFVITSSNEAIDQLTSTTALRNWSMLCEKSLTSTSFSLSLSTLFIFIATTAAGIRIRGNIFQHIALIAKPSIINGTRDTSQSTLLLSFYLSSSLLTAMPHTLLKSRLLICLPLHEGE
jgi:hypothetical protein